MRLRRRNDDLPYSMRRQRTSPFITVALLLMIAGVIFAFTVLVIALANHSDDNTDPRLGPVYMDHGWKQCDGTTLVYHIGRGGSVVPNSPECQR